ncbi:hypothetical protein R3P38DRAFT_2822508 [Favolaschia claudopus]|uniref:Dicer n=1 Tax=Favolaschia claudopus TaxID=2862362 RepID=A0AAW0EH97_9AGAR
MTNIPALPKIDGDDDMVLDIYCHRSLKPTNDMNDEYGDTDRLALLGGRVLEMALVSHYFYKRPFLVAGQIVDYGNEALPYDKLRECFTVWNVKKKFRVAPGPYDILESPEDMQTFFKTYIGGLYVRNGFNQVQAFVSALIDPQGHNADTDMTPPPPLNNPPPLPSHMSNNARSTSNILAQIHQAAQQRALSLTYPADNIGGPPHAPNWRVSCVINGVKRGEAIGKSQKAAKEDASHQAWKSMGW